MVNNHSLFEYWHGSAGAQIFLIAATLTYTVLCNWLLPLEELYSKELHYKQLQNSVTSLAPTMVKLRWRLPLLATTWMGVVFAAIYVVCVTSAGIRLLHTYIPDTLSLNGWQQLSATSLREQTSDASETPGSGLVQFSKQYKYLKNNQQQLEIQMHYVVNTRGEPNQFLSQPTKTKVKDSQKKIIQLDGIGYYELKTDGRKAYLTACINPRGGSTVTSAQFTQNRYTYDFTMSRILPWMLGKEILKDNRCVWAQLSTPLNGATASDAYQILESVWAANYTAWQSRFPPLVSATRIF